MAVFFWGLASPIYFGNEQTGLFFLLLLSGTTSATGGTLKGYPEDRY
jgi:hypothetical protein